VDTLLVVGCADVLARASVVGGSHFSAFIGGLLGLLLLLLLAEEEEEVLGVDLAVEEAAPLEQAATRAAKLSLHLAAPAYSPFPAHFRIRCSGS